MKLVLASGSQRRRELLTMCGYDYEIIVSNADETIDENDPESFVCALSFRKAKEVFDRLFAAGRRDFAVIGSDTVVAFQKDGETKPVIIGKPKDAKDAVRILSMLSGKTHRVFTGVSVIADIPDENAAAQCSIRKKEEIQTECSIREKAEIQTECSIQEKAEIQTECSIQGKAEIQTECSITEVSRRDSRLCEFGRPAGQGGFLRHTGAVRHVCPRNSGQLFHGYRYADSRTVQNA